MDTNMEELANTMQELLINICGRIEDISNRFKSENIFESDRVANLLDDLTALAEATPIFENHYKEIEFSELSEKISMMNDALVQNDLSLFIDIIQFELNDMLKYWKGILAKD